MASKVSVLRLLFPIGLLVIFFVMSHQSHAATVRAVWRSSGSPTLPRSEIGTSQWIDVVFEVDEAGLSGYQMIAFVLADEAGFSGTFNESPPSPLVSSSPATISGGSVIQNINGRAPGEQFLPGPTSVTVLSVQIDSVDQFAGLDPQVVLYQNGTGTSELPTMVPAIVEEEQFLEPNKLVYGYKLVATTEGGAHTSFITGGALGGNGQIALLDAPPLLEEDSRQVLYSYQDGTLQTVAENRGKFILLSEPQMNNTGSVVFFAQDGGLIPTGPNFNQGLYEYRNNTLSKFMEAVPVFVEPPDTPPPGFNALGVGNYINDSRQVVFGANYFDNHTEPDGVELIPFHTIWWKNLNIPNSDPVELYRGRSAEGFVNRPAVYDDVSIPMGFNNAGQILFTTTLDGVIRLVVGGIENGQPAAPTTVASSLPGEFLEFGGNSKLNEDGSVVFTAISSGETFYSLYHWKNGNLTPVVLEQNEFDIEYQSGLGFASADDRVIFAGRNRDFQSALYQWTPDRGIENIFELGPGFEPEDIGDELLDENGVAIRPRSNFSFYPTYILGVDHLGRIALNIQWPPDLVETLVYATPVITPPKKFDLGQSSLGPSGFQFSFEGEPGQSLQLQATTDFVIWTPITDFTTGDAAEPLIDPDANLNELRFYRIIEQ